MAAHRYDRICGSNIFTRYSFRPDSNLAAVHGDVLRYRRYDGTYAVEGELVKGEYSDGEDWGCTYKASFEADGAILVLTALETDKSGNVVSEGEVCKYTKASLDQKEKDAADVVTRSGEETSRRFL